MSPRWTQRAVYGLAGEGGLMWVAFFGGKGLGGGGPVEPKVKCGVASVGPVLDAHTAEYVPLNPHTYKPAPRLHFRT